MSLLDCEMKLMDSMTVISWAITFTHSSTDKIYTCSTQGADSFGYFMNERFTKNQLTG